jgi:hypothetical protein
MPLRKFTYAHYATGVGLLAWLFVALRSITVSITIDEYTSLHQALQYSWPDILLYKGFCLANNHLLTSTWLKAISTQATTPLWLMRLPSILALAAYLYFAYRLTCLLLPKALRWLAFPALVAHVYLLEYFMLARGYGLAMGATMGALYFLLAFWQVPSTRHGVLALLLAVLAALANFSFAYLLLAVLAVVGGRWLLQLRQGLGIPLALLAALAVALGYIYPMGQRILACDALYAGTDLNMLYGLFMPLFKLALYTASDQPWAYLYADWQWGLLVYGTALCLLAGFRYKALWQGPLLLWAMLALLMVAAYMTQKALNGVRYPSERTALYWLPLCLLMALGVWQVLWPRLRLLAYLWLLLVLLPFFPHLNLHHTRDWHYQAQADMALKRLYEAAPGQDTIHLWAEMHSFAPMFYYEDRLQDRPRLLAHTNWLPAYQFMQHRQRTHPPDSLCGMQFIYCARHNYDKLHQRYGLQAPIWENPANDFVLAAWPHGQRCIQEHKDFRLD